MFKALCYLQDHVIKEGEAFVVKYNFVIRIQPLQKAYLYPCFITFLSGIKAPVRNSARVSKCMLGFTAKQTPAERIPKRGAVFLVMFDNERRSSIAIRSTRRWLCQRFLASLGTPFDYACGFFSLLAQESLKSKE
ncbi:hypothetical protein [Pantoea sp.]|uniref:hypothetical protein n=1 Tax=Pantoea sp. TaxID=69393 RepID=UPI002896C979|nr:hypothetical protein [Pantoea sp.]